MASAWGTNRKNYKSVCSYRALGSLRHSEISYIIRELLWLDVGFFGRTCWEGKVGDLFFCKIAAGMPGSLPGDKLGAS